MNGESEPTPVETGNTHQARYLHSERLRALRCFVELFAVAVLQLVTGLGLLVMTSQTLLAVFLVFLSGLSLYLGSIASAYYDSIRPRGDRPTRVEDILCASSRLRLCVLIVDAGLVVGATALLWRAVDAGSDLVLVPAAILVLFGLRAIFMAREYRRARLRELESRE